MADIKHLDMIKEKKKTAFSQGGVNLVKKGGGVLYNKVFLLQLKLSKSFVGIPMPTGTKLRFKVVK